jgi:hypothetical protein
VVEQCAVNYQGRAFQVQQCKKNSILRQAQILLFTFGFADATSRGSKMHVTRHPISLPLSANRCVRCLQNAAATFGEQLLPESLSDAAARTASLGTWQ